MKIIDSNVSESTEKLKSERKSLVKQQILMHKTAIYRLLLRRNYTSKTANIWKRWYCAALHWHL